jgi:hypothetical protein
MAESKPKERSHQGGEAYNTEDEIAFLKGSSPEALAGARQSFFQRTNWGNIDRRQIAEFLGIALDPAEQQAGKRKRGRR